MATIRYEDPKHGHMQEFNVHETPTGFTIEVPAVIGIPAAGGIEEVPSVPAKTWSFPKSALALVFPHARNDEPALFDFVQAAWSFKRVTAPSPYSLVKPSEDEVKVQAVCHKFAVSLLDTLGVTEFAQFTELQAAVNMNTTTGAIRKAEAEAVKQIKQAERAAAREAKSAKGKAEKDKIKAEKKAEKDKIKAEAKAEKDKAKAEKKAEKEAERKRKAAEALDQKARESGAAFKKADDAAAAVKEAKPKAEPKPKKLTKKQEEANERKRVEDEAAAKVATKHEGDGWDEPVIPGENDAAADALLADDK